MQWLGRAGNVRTKISRESQRINRLMQFQHRAIRAFLLHLKTANRNGRSNRTRRNGKRREFRRGRIATAAQGNANYGRSGKTVAFLMAYAELEDPAWRRARSDYARNVIRGIKTPWNKRNECRNGRRFTWKVVVSVCAPFAVARRLLRDFAFIEVTSGV